MITMLDFILALFFLFFGLAPLMFGLAYLMISFSIANLKTCKEERIHVKNRR